SVPAELPMPAIGARVAVKFSGRRTVAVCVAQNPADAHDRLSPLIEVLDDDNLLGEDLWRLAQWMADYYQHPLGEVIATLLPSAARVPKRLKIVRPECWEICGPAGDLTRAPRQARLYECLLAAGGRLQTELLYEAGFQRSHIVALAARGLIRKAQGVATGSLRASLPVAGRADQLELNPEQALALAKLGAASGFKPALLDGVTGSGKTEVYLRLMEEVLKLGRQVLVLVPEIALTPQTLSRFEDRFGKAAVLHSNLTDRARLQVWLRARAGELGILIGTRSAVLSPFADLGLIVVDEEHDASFKQSEGLRYSARDVAVKRAQNLDIPLILGSATPSFESLHNARSGRYQHLRLTERAGRANMPTYRLLDIRGHSLQDGFSDTLVRNIERHLEAGGQVLVFLNRRGFAPALLCGHCGWQAECAACERRMTMHRKPPCLICHHCGRRADLPEECPDCRHQTLIAVGLGTQRSEAFLSERFPEVPVYRIDRDTVRSQRRMEERLAAIHSGERAILVGTQMLAKGHHFPDVSLVAVINADGGFMSPDFRAPERTAQLIVQVAGRAGRAERPGEVLIQTYQPDSPQLRALIEEGYGAFAQRELAGREAADLPPYQPIALVRAESGDADLARSWLESIRSQLGKDLECFGPAPALIPRVADRWRFQLMVGATTRAVLHRGLHPLLAVGNGPRNLRWSLDIDPYDTF
ncbi:MAG: primosomal protein N', partial [Pseudomonadales bacterium]|nr:primosomal protein N' [Pseudomonadales bacterium]